MVHTKYHSLQTDNHLNWKNRDNEISKCPCNACAHLIWLILIYVCMYPLSDATYITMAYSKSVKW